MYYDRITLGKFNALTFLNQQVFLNALVDRCSVIILSVLLFVLVF